MGTDYYQGDGPARIAAKNIQPRVFQDHLDLTAALMNNCFRIYHRGYHALDDIVVHASGTGKYRPLSDLQDKIRADLRSAASTKSGWNAGPLSMGWSLADCFQHLAQNNGVWKDDTWNGNGQFKAPAGIFAFQDAMIVRGKEIAASQSEFNTWQANLSRWKQQKLWDSLGNYLDYGKKVVDKVGSKIWVTSGFTEVQAGQHNQLAVKWLNYGGQVKSFMDSFIRVKAAGKDGQRQLVAEVAAFVVEGLPVFGSAYADVIRGVPKLMSYFEDYAQRTARAIDGRV